MKKTTLTATLCGIMLPFSVLAQITVQENRTVIGEIKELTDPGTVISPLSLSIGTGVSTPDNLDSNADLIILGKESANSGSRLTFGTGDKVYIGEFGTTDTDKLSCADITV